MTEAIKTLLTHKLHHYLHGRGHPQHPEVAVHLPFEEEPRLHGDSDNLKALRSRLFLRFATGSELMPTGAWDVSVSIL